MMMVMVVQGASGSVTRLTTARQTLLVTRRVRHALVEKPVMLRQCYRGYQGTVDAPPMHKVVKEYLRPESDHPKNQQSEN